MNELSEKEKQMCRKKWLDSFEKYGDRTTFPLHGTHSEVLSPGGQNKIVLTKKRKAETYTYESENEDGTMTVVDSNPRIHHSTEGNKKFKNETSEEKHKEKLTSSRLCNNKIRERQNDDLGKYCPKSQESQDVYSNSFQSRDIPVMEHRAITSGSVKKKKKKKTVKPDIKGHHSECNPPGVPVEQATKIEAKATIGSVLFDCMKEDSPFKSEKETSIGSSGNKLTKNGAKGPCRSILENVGLLNRNKDSSNKKMDNVVSSSKKNKNNHDHNDQNYSKNDIFNKHLMPDKCNTVNNADTNASNMSTINKISTPAKIRKVSKNCKKVGVKKKHGAVCKGNKKAKTACKRDKSKRISKGDPVSICESKSTELLSKVEPALNLDNHDHNDQTYSKNNISNKRLISVKCITANNADTNVSNMSTINEISTPAKIRKVSKNCKKVKKKHGSDCKGNKKTKTSCKRNKSKRTSKGDPVPICESKSTELLSKVEPALNLDSDYKSPETQGTLQTSGCLKDFTVFEGQPAGLPTNNNQEYTGQEKKNANPKPDQPDVDGTSDSIEDIIAKARSLIIKCRKNSLLFKYNTYKREACENMKFRPLKKNILMRVSTRDDLDVGKEKWALAYNSPTLYTSLKPETYSWDEFKMNNDSCLSNSTAPEQGNQDSKSDQMYSIIDDDTDEAPNSPPPVTLGETPSLALLSSVEDRVRPRHPKKTMLDKFRRGANKSFQTENISNEDQAIYHPIVQQDDHISKADQVPLSAGISEKKSELTTKETVNENITPGTAPTSIHVPMCAANSTKGVCESRPEIYKDSRTFLFHGQEKPMNNMYPCQQHCINTGYPFAFSVECICSSNYHRVGYIHRRFPAVSVPCIIIGEVKFVTVRGALKLFSGFNENGFIQHFLRTARNNWICSQYQASCLRKSSNLSELDLMEGDVLVQVGPLLHNFHCFQHAKRLLLQNNHPNVTASHYHEHQ